MFTLLIIYEYEKIAHLNSYMAISRPQIFTTMTIKYKEFPDIEKS